MRKMTNELNDENVEKIKNSTDICEDVECKSNCKLCVQLYLKTLLNKTK